VLPFFFSACFHKIKSLHPQIYFQAKRQDKTNAQSKRKMMEAVVVHAVLLGIARLKNCENEIQSAQQPLLIVYLKSGGKRVPLQPNSF